jgi:hypothetical protein
MLEAKMNIINCVVRQRGPLAPSRRTSLPHPKVERQCVSARLPRDGEIQKLLSPINRYSSTVVLLFAADVVFVDCSESGVISSIMPLVQDDPINGLNNFIDVANKDDHNPIVVAARQMPRRSSTLSVSSQRNYITKSRGVSVAESVCSEPDLSNHKRASAASSTNTTYDDRNQSVRIGRFQTNVEGIDFNEASRGIIQNEDSDHSRKYSSGTIADNEEHTVPPKGAALGAISEATLLDNEERINYLEQEMAKLSFD